MSPFLDAGVVTLAGGYFGASVGFLDGTGAQASFANPMTMAMDLSGNLLVADRYNQRIRRVTPDGSTSWSGGARVSVIAYIIDCGWWFHYVNVQVLSHWLAVRLAPRAAL